LYSFKFLALGNCVVCVHETKLGPKNRVLKVFLIWKNVTIYQNGSVQILEEPSSNLYSIESSHKFLNVRTRREVLSKWKNWTTLIYTMCRFKPVLVSYWKTTWVSTRVRIRVSNNLCVGSISKQYPTKKIPGLVLGF